MKIIGVIGAGQMGAGITQVCLAVGFSVRLLEISKAAHARAQQQIKIGLEKISRKGKITSEAECLSRLDLTTFAEELSECDLIIEAVPEDFTLKAEALAEVARLCSPECILATNTSSLSITRLAATLPHPEKVIGVHFMNPVPVMPLVEIIRGLLTSHSTFEKITQFVTALEKTGVVSADRPGFIVNRLLIPMINEAIFALYEGVATAEDIDTAMRLGTNHPIGPLALADLIGLDTCLAIMRVLHQDLGEDKYRPCPLLVQYVAAGRWGKKTNHGFFEYSHS